MSKSQLQTGAGVLLVYAILWSDPGMRVIFVGLGFACLIASYFRPATRIASTPRTITRLPTRYEQRRRWGLGLGLTPLRRLGDG